MPVIMDARKSRIARAALDWTLPELATKAGLGVNTVARFEASKSNAIRYETVLKIAQTFRDHGVEFLDDNTVRYPDADSQSQVA